MNRMLAIVEDGNDREVFIDGMEGFFVFQSYLERYLDKEVRFPGH